MSEELRVKKVELSDYELFCLKCFDDLASNFDDPRDITRFVGQCWKVLMKNCPIELFAEFFNDELASMTEFTQKFWIETLKNKPELLDIYKIFESELEAILRGQEEKQG